MLNKHTWGSHQQLHDELCLGNANLYKLDPPYYSIGIDKTMIC